MVATRASAKVRPNPMMTTLFMEVHLLSFWILRTPALCRGSNRHQFLRNGFWKKLKLEEAYAPERRERSAAERIELSAFSEERRDRSRAVLDNQKMISFKTYTGKENCSGLKRLVLDF
jgi:hypothetical protein